MVSKLRIIVAEFEGEGDASLDFLAALREALGATGTTISGDVVTLRQFESEPPAPAKPVPAPVIHEPPAAPPPRPAKRVTSERSEERVPHAQQAKRRINAGPGGGPSIASQIVDAFRVNQATTKAELAKAIYGNSLPESIAKVQSQLYMLTNTGRLNRLGMGRYEVVS